MLCLYGPEVLFGLGKRRGHLVTETTTLDAIPHAGAHALCFHDPTVCPVGQCQEAERRGLRVTWATVNGKMIGAPVLGSMGFQEKSKRIIFCQSLSNHQPDIHQSDIYVH